MTELEKMSEDLEKDHSQLKQKIERKAADLDRAEKRYRTLKKVSTSTCFSLCSSAVPFFLKIIVVALS